MLVWGMRITGGVCTSFNLSSSGWLSFALFAPVLLHVKLLLHRRHFQRPLEWVAKQAYLGSGSIHPSCAIQSGPTTKYPSAQSGCILPAAELSQLPISDSWRQVRLPDMVQWVTASGQCTSVFGLLAIRFIAKRGLADYRFGLPVNRHIYHSKTEHLLQDLFGDGGEDSHVK